MQTFFKTIQELVDNNEKYPLPLEVIPNNMGINLSSTEAISWQEKDNGQLTSLTIYFLPSEDAGV